MSDGAVYAGIDVGSATAKAVLLDAAGVVRGTSVIASGGNLSDSAQRCLAFAAN